MVYVGIYNYLTIQDSAVVEQSLLSRRIDRKLESLNYDDRLWPA